MAETERAPPAYQVPLVRYMVEWSVLQMDWPLKSTTPGLTGSLMAVPLYSRVKVLWK